MEKPPRQMERYWYSMIALLLVDKGMRYLVPTAPLPETSPDLVSHAREREYQQIQGPLEYRR